MVLEGSDRLFRAYIGACLSAGQVQSWKLQNTLTTKGSLLCHLPLYINRPSAEHCEYSE
jgi:hypothetical protein